MFEQLIAMGHFWHQGCWLDGLNVGWLRAFPHHYVRRLHGEVGGEGVGEYSPCVCETVICCAYGHV